MNSSSPLALSVPARRVFAANLIATVTSTTAIAAFAISMAVLIFANDLSAGLPRAIGAFVVAGGLLTIWITAKGHVVPTAVTIQDGPAMVVAALVADFATDAQTQVVDVFVLLGLTSAATGALLWTIGWLRLGRLVRCMPTTVVGAFVAGTGWLLVKGGFDVMTRRTLDIGDVGALFEPEIGRFWLPGLVVGLVAWFVGRSDRTPPYAVGLIIIASVVGFYCVVVATSSVATAESAGWLVGPFPESSGAALVSPTELVQANWGGTIASLPGVASVMGLSAVVVLLNLTGIGAQRGERIDVDAELRVAGLANICVAPLGASPGFHSMGYTLLLTRLGATRRYVPAAVGVSMLLLGVLGVGALGSVPRMVPGALLIAVGLGLLEQWVRDLTASTSRLEQALSVGVVLVIAWSGILSGIGVGLVASCAAFTVRYSRIDPVRFKGSGCDLVLEDDPAVTDPTVLATCGDQLAIFQLQGYLFFGSASSLENQVRMHLFTRPNDAPPLETVILDFTHVTGIGNSAVAVIEQLMDELRAVNVTVVLSAITAGATIRADSQTCTFREALWQWESQQNPVGGLPSVAPRFTMLSPRLQAHFQRIALPAGAVAAEQGTKSEGVLLVETGSLAAYRVDDDHEPFLLPQITDLEVVGGHSLVRGACHTAEVVAVTAVFAQWLSAERYDRLCRDEPALTTELHRFLRASPNPLIIL